MYIRFKILLLLLFIGLCAYSQDFTFIQGKITDENNLPIANVNVFTSDTAYGSTSNNAGNFKFKIPSNKEVKIIFSHLEYFQIVKKVKGKPNETIELNTKLEIMFYNLNEVWIEDQKDRINNLIRIDPKTVEIIPSVSGGIEAVIKTIGLGVVSRTELSSQYSVRGGNFDENLVYVNDIEVYRPFLTRSGQQEGLSFINADMVSSVLFSSGGFNAKYGDKMSSVLDIKYKKPHKRGGTIAASLLGGSAHFEGCSKDYRFTHISGLRYKTNQYVLGSLDTKGEYRPSFIDFQTYLTYDISDIWEISFLGNYAKNKYHFVPENRETTFGGIQEALGLMIYFDGQELTEFNTYFGAFATEYHPNKKLNLKFITSGFRTIEAETFDIQGQYYLNELDKQMGSDNLGDSLMNIGIGTFLEHARNYLDATVINAYHKGHYENKRNDIFWGIKLQHEIINDAINEWTMRDSAGHSLPFPDTSGYYPGAVNLSETIISNHNIESNRVTSYIQNTLSFDIDSAILSITGGLRAHYWDFNKQLLISPRVSFALKPNWDTDILFKFSAGYYYQPPFYKELRDLEGNIHNDVKAQQSIHLVLGSDYNFKIWKRPFKFITEVYYKDLNNLIPYQIDNVRIRYYGSNNANGYAMGIDMKLNGEFVPGVDSWASLSVMQTREDITDDFYYDYFNANGEQIYPDYDNDSIASTIRVEPGFIPRPSDQMVNFGLFFQDYLPRNPSYKMQLSLLFGSRLPFGPPNSERYLHTLKMPPYRRVDIGFGKVLKSEGKELKPGNPFKHFKSVWLTLEIFNLLGIKNTVSYLWINDIYNRQWAVPNYLSNRKINLKLIAKF